MYMDLTGASQQTAYHAIMQLIIPRPIAWVLSDNGSERPAASRWNLAPFSMFNGVCSEPPMVMFSIGSAGRPEGTIKDTWLNIERRQHFVVHLVHRGIAREMVQSSAPLPHGDSEVTHLGLPLTGFEEWPVPRLAVARAAFACTRELMLAVGTRPQMLVIGRVHKVWLDDGILVTRPDKTGRVYVDPKRFDPLGRLDGEYYAGLGELLRIPPPDQVATSNQPSAVGTAGQAPPGLGRMAGC